MRVVFFGTLALPVFVVCRWNCSVFQPLQEGIKTRARKKPRNIEKYRLLNSAETLPYLKADNNSRNNYNNSEINDTKKRKKRIENKEEKENKENIESCPSGD